MRGLSNVGGLAEIMKAGRRKRGGGCPRWEEGRGTGSDREGSKPSESGGGQG